MCGSFPRTDCCPHAVLITLRAFKRCCFLGMSNDSQSVVPHSQLHVMSVETDECLHWGPIGGSVINALHFARDNRGAFM